MEKKNAATRMARTSATRWTGNILFFKGGLKYIRFPEQLGITKNVKSSSLFYSASSQESSRHEDDQNSISDRPWWTSDTLLHNLVKLFGQC